MTADVYYHVGHDILAAGFVVIDPDHHMEAIAATPMAAKVHEWFGEQLTAFPTTTNTDPYTYI